MQLQLRPAFGRCSSSLGFGYGVFTIIEGKIRLVKFMHDCLCLVRTNSAETSVALNWKREGRGSVDKMQFQTNDDGRYIFCSVVLGFYFSALSDQKPWILMELPRIETLIDVL